jgi:hypothetical protein
MLKRKWRHVEARGYMWRHALTCGGYMPYEEEDTCHMRRRIHVEACSYVWRQGITCEGMRPHAI